MDGLIYDLLLLMRGGGQLTDDEPVDTRQVSLWIGSAIAELMDGEVLLAAQQNRDVNPDLYQTFSVTEFTPINFGKGGVAISEGVIPKPLSATGKVWLKDLHNGAGTFLSAVSSRQRLYAGIGQSGWGRWKGSDWHISYCYEADTANTGKLLIAYSPEMGLPDRIEGEYIPAKPWEMVPSHQTLPIPARWIRQVRLRLLSAEGKAILSTTPDPVNNGTNP